VKTNLPFHRAIVDNAAFVDAEVSTNLLDRVGPAAFVGEPAEAVRDR
jgi:acetyl/propionyl-CoA carboxylase alpha subunit